VPSYEVRSYAKDMKPSCNEYGTKSRNERTEATGIYSLVFISYMRWLSSKHLALQEMKYV